MTETLREKLARIIDPEAYDETHAEDNDEAAAIFKEAWEEALAKADQCIAALPLREAAEALEPFAHEPMDGHGSLAVEFIAKSGLRQAIWPRDFRRARTAHEKLKALL